MGEKASQEDMCRIYRHLLILVDEQLSISSGGSPGVVLQVTNPDNGMAQIMDSGHPEYELRRLAAELYRRAAKHPMVEGLLCEGDVTASIQGIICSVSDEERYQGNIELMQGLLGEASRLRL
ncbi:MAG: hypothetical protein KJ709_01770 [Nanoarchaeota archaeon]|nr:hypothetical protein [Nanoarchaeota archaeon]